MAGVSSCLLFATLTSYCSQRGISTKTTTADEPDAWRASARSPLACGAPCREYDARQSSCIACLPKRPSFAAQRPTAICRGRPPGSAYRRPPRRKLVASVNARCRAPRWSSLRGHEQSYVPAPRSGPPLRPRGHQQPIGPGVQLPSLLWHLRQVLRSTPNLLSPNMPTARRWRPPMKGFTLAR